MIAHTQKKMKIKLIYIMILRDKIKGRGLLGMAVGMVMAQCSLFSLTACSDTWEEHYDNPVNNGKQSLMTLIDADPQLSNFGKLLRATHLYVNDRRSTETYADLLSSDQSLTVWAPVNGTYNADSLIALCNTEKGDSGVATHFVCNHIARSLHGLTASTDENVRMINRKYVPVSGTNVGGSDATAVNIPARNGILHKLNGDAYYYYNIYDAITSLDEYAHFGVSFMNFERRELNENASVVADIVNGQKIYSDSVTYTDNRLFYYFGAVNAEDSTFFMLAPSKEIWTSVYAEAEKYFNYGNVAKADSIQSFWTTVSLLRDLFYNSNSQKNVNDSIVSNMYSRLSWPYHVYYDPYGKDGIITRAEVGSVRQCSNGYIMNMTKWPFTVKDIFFHPITMQGESTWNITEHKDCTYDVLSAIGDTVSGNAYIDIKSSQNKNWSISFNVGETLSGTYDICAAVLPKTVYRASAKDFRPNKLFASVEYVDENGKKRTVEFKDPAVSSGYTADTLCFGRVTLPVCSYGQQEPNLKVTIKCTLGRTETKFSRECLFDCIYLRPITEEDIENEANQNGARLRKEAKK